MIEKIGNLKKEISSSTINNKEDLEDFRLKFLSRNGKVQEMFKLMGSVPNEKKASVGKAMNEVKNLAQQKFDDAKAELHKKEKKSFGASDDISLPVLLATPDPCIR